MKEGRKTSAELRAFSKLGDIELTERELHLRPVGMSDDQLMFCIACMEDDMDDADFKKYLADCVGKTDDQIADLGHERTSAEAA